MEGIIEINQVDNFNEICIFRSVEDANAFVENLVKNKIDEDKKPKVVCICKELKIVEKDVLSLIESYKKIVFIVDDEENFFWNEVAGFSLLSDKILYETQDKFVSKPPFKNIISDVCARIRCNPNLPTGESDSWYISWWHDQRTFIIFYKNMCIKLSISNVMGTSAVLHYKILTNYVPEITKINIYMDESKQQEASLELAITDKRGNTTFVELPAKNKHNLSGFRNCFYRLGNYIDCLNQSDYMSLLEEMYEKTDIPKNYIYKRAGLVKNEGVWVYTDNVISLDDSKPEKNITLSENALYQPKLNYSIEYTPNELAYNLLENISFSYNKSIEPLLIIGLAYMAPFKDLFRELSNGFPVAYLYGPTSAGKTNLLKTIAYSYGYLEHFINSGDSTLPSMWQNLDSLYSQPVIYDEISSRTICHSFFDGLIKSAYQGINRGKINEKNNINATLMLSSNAIPPQKPEIRNRLVLCNFSQNNFIRDEAKKFNFIRKKYLSNLLPAILKYGEEEIEALFDKNKLFIELKSKNIDIRSIDNIAIAYTGYQLLLKIADQAEPPEISEAFVKFLVNYSGELKINSPLDDLLKSLPFLVRNKSIILDKDFKVETKDNQRILSIHINYACKPFAQHYKTMNGNTPPTLEEIYAYAKCDSRVFLGSEQVTKLVRFGDKPKRALVIDITGIEELNDLELE